MQQQFQEAYDFDWDHALEKYKIMPSDQEVESPTINAPTIHGETFGVGEAIENANELEARDGDVVVHVDQDGFSENIWIFGQQDMM